LAKAEAKVFLCNKYDILKTKILYMFRESVDVNFRELSSPQGKTL